MGISVKDTIKLNSGNDIPVIGLGTWLSKPNEVATAVKVALQHGYRHIDGAAIYQNEEEVGRGIRDSGVSREEIFLTSKLWNNSHAPEDVEKALDKTLADLGVDYLDLYLIHWPVAFKAGEALVPKDPETKLAITADVSIEETWKAVEKLVDTGKVKSIGVSNFTVEHLERILKIATIKPAVNQIEAHPFLLQEKLHALHKEHNIVPTAYSPFGNNVYNKPRVIDDARAIKVADSIHKPVANVILSYLVTKGFVVIPKSVTPSRIESNFEIFDLPSEAVKELDALNTDTRYNDPTEWGVDIFGEHGGNAAVREQVLAGKL